MSKSNKTIRPLGDRVVVKAIEQEKMSEGGIMLPGLDGVATDKPDEGIVVAVGKGKMMDNGEINPVDIEVGDHVVYAPMSGSHIEIDDEVFIVFSEAQIFGVIGTKK